MFRYDIVTNKSNFGSPGHENVVRLLLESGANINAIDAYGRSALILAVQKGILQTLKKYLKKI